MANNNTLIFVGLGAVALLLLFKSKANAAPTGNFNLDSLDEPNANLQALDKLYNALTSAQDPNTGQSLSDVQIQLLLSQALLETGLFTDSPNWTLVNGNNYGGIVAHGSFPANANGRFAAYPDVSTFVTDWLRVLSKGPQPLEADNVSDFNTRLQATGYYGSDDPTTYSNNLQYYFNLLGNVLK